MSGILWKTTMDLPLSVQLDRINIINPCHHAEHPLVWVHFWVYWEWGQAISFYTIRNNKCVVCGIDIAKLSSYFFTYSKTPGCITSCFLFFAYVVKIDYWASSVRKQSAGETCYSGSCTYKYLHLNNTPHVHLETSIFTKYLGSHRFYSQVWYVYGLSSLLVSAQKESQFIT